MFKQLLNKIRAKMQGGSTDKQGNYYSPKDDEKLAARQSMSQQLRTLNPTGSKGKEQPNNPAKNVVYSGQIEQPSFSDRLKKTLPKWSAQEKKVTSGKKPSPASKQAIDSWKKTERKALQSPPKARPLALPTATPTPTLKEWKNFEKYIADQARSKGYHPGAIVSQKAIESARGTSNFARERNNYGGIGAYDSNPDNAFSYATPEAYLEDYFKLIERKYPKAYKNRKNPKLYTKYLKEGNYATDPEYEWKIQNTPEFRKYSK